MRRHAGMPLPPSSVPISHRLFMGKVRRTRNPARRGLSSSPPPAPSKFARMLGESRGEFAPNEGKKKNAETHGEKVRSDDNRSADFPLSARRNENLSIDCRPLDTVIENSKRGARCRSGTHSALTVSRLNRVDRVTFPAPSPPPFSIPLTLALGGFSRIFAN